MRNCVNKGYNAKNNAKISKLPITGVHDAVSRRVVTRARRYVGVVGKAEVMTDLVRHCCTDASRLCTLVLHSHANVTNVRKKILKTSKAR